MRIHAHFLVQHGIRPTDVETIGRQSQLLRQNDLDARQIQIDRGARFDNIGHAFHPYPQAGKATHGPAVLAVIEILLHRRRIQHGNAAGLEDVFTLMRSGRRFGRVIVTGDHQYAAMLRRSRHIGMLEYVTTAIDAGPFTVPHGEHTIDLGTSEHIDLLRAPNCRCGQIFVHARMKVHAVRIEIGFGFGGRHIERAQR